MVDMVKNLWEEDDSFSEKSRRGKVNIDEGVSIFTVNEDENARIMNK